MSQSPLHEDQREHNQSERTTSQPPPQESPSSQVTHNNTLATADSGDHVQSDTSDQTHLDSEDEGLLETSVTGDEVAQLLRATVEELEIALEDSRKMLSERDAELTKVRGELDRYRQQAAREIANKTKLAQSLDESHSHAQELDELLQKWQLELRESKIQRERLESSLQQEHSRSDQLERQLSDMLLEKDKELEQIKTQLVDARQKLNQDSTRRMSKTLTIAEDSNPGPEGVDKMQLHFLKQAVYHLLTDFHAEDQLRAILSILDFSAQERKAVYAKVEEKKKYTRSLYK